MNSTNNNITEIINVEKAICIVHFKQDDMPGRRCVYYQVFINGDMQSPTGEFIRFDSVPVEGRVTEEMRSEIHGWVKLDDIVIDEVLKEFTEEELEAGDVSVTYTAEQVA